MIYPDSIYVWIPNNAKNILLGAVAISGPMLKVDCIISHKPLAPSPSTSLPPFQTHMLTYIAQFYYISMLEVLYVGHMY